MAQKFDAIIIGTGQAGPSLAIELAQDGKKVAILEEAAFGGTCINNGCTPTKTLVASAKIANSVTRSEEFGIREDDIQFNFPEIMARKTKIVKSFTERVENSLKSTPGCTVFQGHGAFLDAHQVQVGDQILEASQIFINVGSRAFIPKIPGLEQIPYLTNVSALKLTTLPKHLLVLGGGYIGLEFAQIFHRLGSEVTVINQGPKIMSKEDPEVSQTLQEILQKEGIQIINNCKNFRILPNSKDGEIKAESERGPLQGSHLLIATGRVPNTENLGLNLAGVQLDSKGFIVVDDELRTSQKHIWALGDCNGKGAFTHTSYDDFRIVRDHLFKKGSRKVSDRIPIYALYTDPPLGRVGLNEQEAKAKYPHTLIATMPMSKVARALEKGETKGFMKVIVDGDSNQILGASFLGTDCDEVVQLIAIMMTAKTPYTILEKTVLIHPTISELLPTLFEQLQ